MARWAWLVGFLAWGVIVPRHALAQVTEVRAELIITFLGGPVDLRQYQTPDNCQRVTIIGFFQPGEEDGTLSRAFSRARAELEEQQLTRVGIITIEFLALGEPRSASTLLLTACGWGADEQSRYRSLFAEDIPPLGGLFRQVLEEAGPAMAKQTREWCQCRDPWLQLRSIVIEPPKLRARILFRARWPEDLRAPRRDDVGTDTDGNLP